MAHMLARLVYRMLKFGHEYVDRGLEFYETKYRQPQVHWSPNKPLLCVCNLFHLRRFPVKFLESGPSPERLPKSPRKTVV
jgi:hypothetical protein